MKYLNTKFKLFTESVSNEDGVGKYEIVQFTEEYTIENIFGVDRNISVNVNKGDKLKLYFNIKESTNDKYSIIGIRPIEVLHNESKKAKKSKKTSFNLSELWEGNFILNVPMVINKKDSPFTIEKYL